MPREWLQRVWRGLGHVSTFDWLLRLALGIGLPGGVLAAFSDQLGKMVPTAAALILTSLAFLGMAIASGFANVVRYYAPLRPAPPVPAASGVAPSEAELRLARIDAAEAKVAALKDVREMWVQGYGLRRDLIDPKTTLSQGTRESGASEVDRWIARADALVAREWKDDLAAFQARRQTTPADLPWNLDLADLIRVRMARLRGIARREVSNPVQGDWPYEPNDPDDPYSA